MVERTGLHGEKYSMCKWFLTSTKTPPQSAAKSPKLTAD